MYLRLLPQTPRTLIALPTRNEPIGTQRNATEHTHLEIRVDGSSVCCTYSTLHYTKFTLQ